MRYRPVPSPVSNDQVIGSINTTPLIDVMLVLLIMFIMIIPETTHKVPLDLPQPSPATGAPPTLYRLDLDAAGQLRWNGAAISEAELPARLAAVEQDANGQLNFRADGETRYERFDEVLAAIKRAGIHRLGLVDNARFMRP